MQKIEVSASISAPLQKVWEYWTKPEHITQWNFASPEWHCPQAENDPQPGGKFSWRMEARDGSVGFDYAGTYDQVEEGK
ncbi:MAG: SRPBCC domain-containing protein [Bacteroidota bacterium]